MGKLYGKEEIEGTPAERFRGVIRRAYEQTGKPVVVLIDEYDAPLLDSNHLPELQNELREEMRKFFSPLKVQGAHYTRLVAGGRCFYVFQLYRGRITHQN